MKYRFARDFGLVRV